MDLSADLALGLQLNDPGTDWRVAPTPTRTTRNKPINFAGGSTLVIPSTAKHPKEALAFLLWLTSQQGQRLKYGLDNSLGLSKQDLYTGAVPANRAVAQVLRKDPNWKQALATVDVPTQPDGPSPVFSKAYQVLADMQARIILKNANVMAELKAAQRQVQKLLDAPGDGDLLSARDKAMLEVLYSSGIRVSELVELEMQDLDLQEGVLRVKGKGRKDNGD